MTEEEALPEVPPVVARKGVLSLRLDALDDAEHAKRTGEKGDGVRNPVPGATVAKAQGEVAGELKPRHGILKHGTESRIAGTEVVEDEFTAEVSERLEVGTRSGRRHQHARFRDLKAQLPGPRSSGGKRLAHHTSEIGGSDLARRHVDEDLAREAGAVNEELAGVVKHGSSERNHQIRIFGDRDELVRQKEAALRVLPPHECLVGHNLARLEIDNRLVVDNELAFADGGTELGLDGQLGEGMLAH